MPDISIRLLINIFLVLGALFAIWKGGPAERIAAVIVLANALLGEGSHWLIPKREFVVHLLNDGLTALALLGITIRYGALWMGGVMLFFAAQFSLQSYFLVAELPPDYFYALINNIDFVGITWCLIIGTVVAWRRRVRLIHASGAPAT